MLGIDDTYQAFCFDQACANFGTHVQVSLEEVKGKTEAQVEGKRSVVLAKLLGQTPRYRDPATAARAPKGKVDNG